MRSPFAFKGLQEVGIREVVSGFRLDMIEPTRRRVNKKPEGRKRGASQRIHTHLVEDGRVPLVVILGLPGHQQRNE